MGRNKKYKLKKKRGIFALTTIFAIAVVAICCAFAWYQLINIEQGILDVCATQQDAYVQLVVDQINLKENRDDEEIITDILSTLDSSSNKYWTFSKDRSMLFVKDVIETNRYKGLTVISYYDSKSAKQFLEGLRLDEVIHRNIEINDKEYVASGVAFNYDGEEYRLCLLTNKDVILNNNRFMVAKFEAIILVGFMLIIVLVGSMLFARKLENKNYEIAKRDADIRELNENVTQLNELLAQKEHFNTRYQIWSQDVVDDFLHKLIGKKVRTATLIKINCEDELAKFDFLERACVLLDKKILRFAIKDTDVLLLAIQHKEYEVKNMLEPLLNYGVKLENSCELELSHEVVNAYIRTLGMEK
ncbi:MAG: hypothetical protein IKL73_06740 [Lachnospiraceae bacterium]|nr:hypothetical protein [Lachnospira sp.]MBR6697942.1 hypothetical protein [Lachnospiraceae bacterium]